MCRYRNVLCVAGVTGGGGGGGSVCMCGSGMCGVVCVGRGCSRCVQVCGSGSVAGVCAGGSVVCAGSVAVVVVVARVWCVVAEGYGDNAGGRWRGEVKSGRQALTSAHVVRRHVAHNVAATIATPGVSSAKCSQRIHAATRHTIRQPQHVTHIVAHIAVTPSTVSAQVNNIVTNAKCHERRGARRRAR